MIPRNRVVRFGVRRLARSRQDVAFISRQCALYRADMRELGKIDTTRRVVGSARVMFALVLCHLEIERPHIILLAVLLPFLWIAAVIYRIY